MLRRKKEPKRRSGDTPPKYHQNLFITCTQTRRHTDRYEHTSTTAASEKNICYTYGVTGPQSTGAQYNCNTKTLVLQLYCSRIALVGPLKSIERGEI